MSKNAETKTTTFDDGTFLRTALVVRAPRAGSIDVLDKRGKRVCQINIFVGEGSLIVDVLDVDKHFPRKRALCFTKQERRVMETFEASTLVSVDFRGKEKGDDEA